MTTRRLFAEVKNWMEIKTDTELSSRLAVSTSSIVHHMMDNILSEKMILAIYDNTNFSIEKIRELHEKDD